ncbi:uncharacterized protein LOC133205713 isoform X2 [Saccostrea echinata]|uniref:uncharacterized protein LOC133205713 isoform X2 n=1 Tax=Saccostrea echinata TaxID=191078 RepID=UPI002A81647C|nr:uncharacterized protein LOC133205713 isoform X2 [Saccostrea echinata]
MRKCKTIRVGKRETHLNYSLAYSKNRATRLQTTELVDIEKARQRNEKYLQDLMSISENLKVEGDNPVSPRLATLQSNYWAMVKSLKPLWEENLHLDDNRTPRSLISEPSVSVHDSRAATIPGSARSQKSANVNFRAPVEKSEPKVVKQTVKKPERKSKKLKK